MAAGCSRKVVVAEAARAMEGVPQRAPSSYQAFLSRLNHPESAALLRSIKTFVRNALAATELSVDALAEATAVLYEQTEETIAEHPQWAGCDQAELERAADGVEKYVMTRLHDRVFAFEAEEKAEDEQLSTWLQRLRFLKVEHLAISPEFRNLAPWASAQQELGRIATYKTPRDKLVSILNCCKRINAALSQASAGGHGADEFFPVLLFVTVQAAPAGVHASLQYISRFRHPTKLVSEAAYYLTHMQSALSFLSSVRPEQLCIEAAAFEAGLAETHAAMERQKAETATAKAAAEVAAAEAAAAAAAEAEAAAETEAASIGADGGASEAAAAPAQSAVDASDAIDEADDAGATNGHAGPRGLTKAGARGAASAFFASLLENSPGPSRASAIDLLFDTTAATPQSVARAEQSSGPMTPATPHVGIPRPGVGGAVSQRLGGLLGALPPLPQSSTLIASAPSAIESSIAAANGANGGACELACSSSSSGHGGGRGARTIAPSRPSGYLVGTELSVRRADAADGDEGGVHVHVELKLGTWVAMRRRQLVCERGPVPSLRFLETRSVLELTMGEVAELLEEYKWLSQALDSGWASAEAPRRRRR